MGNCVFGGFHTYFPAACINGFRHLHFRKKEKNTDAHYSVQREALTNALAKVAKLQYFGLKAPPYRVMNVSNITPGTEILTSEIHLAVQDNFS